MTKEAARTEHLSAIKNLQTAYRAWQKEYAAASDERKTEMLREAAARGAPKAKLIQALAINPNVNANPQQTPAQQAHNARTSDSQTADIIRSLSMLKTVPSLTPLLTSSRSIFKNPVVLTLPGGCGTPRTGLAAPGTYFRTANWDGVSIAPSGQLAGLPFRALGGDIFYAGIAPDAAMQAHIDKSILCYNMLSGSLDSAFEITGKFTGGVNLAQQINNMFGVANTNPEMLEGGVLPFIQGQMSFYKKSQATGNLEEFTFVLPCKWMVPFCNVTRREVTVVSGELTGEGQYFMGYHRIVANVAAPVEVPINVVGHRDITSVVVALIFPVTQANLLAYLGYDSRAGGNAGVKKFKVGGIWEQTYSKYRYKVATPHNDDRIDCSHMSTYTTIYKGVLCLTEATNQSASGRFLVQTRAGTRSSRVPSFTII